MKSNLYLKLEAAISDLENNISYIDYLSGLSFNEGLEADEIHEQTWAYMPLKHLVMNNEIMKEYISRIQEENIRDLNGILADLK